MSYLLNIETATTNCSVALCENDQVLHFIELNDGYKHAENLHVFIQNLLKECNVTPQQLNAVAVSEGPGSYTGLRIGVTAAKGMAYALKIPLIGIHTLQSMCAQLTETTTEGLFCPMIDARRMEVYCAIFDANLKEIDKTRAKIINLESIKDFDFQTPIYFFGDGMPKCKEILSQFKFAKFIEAITPSANSMAKLSYKKFIHQEFENVAYFEPFYLKEYFITKK